MAEFIPVDHDPFAAETFVPPILADWAKQAAGKDVDTIRKVGKGVADLAQVPEKAVQNSQFSVGTGTYDPGPTLEAAALPMGTGAVAGVPLQAGEEALGAGLLRRDPSLWHGISKVRLPKPISEMQATHVPTGGGVEKEINPADLQGGYLLPAIGDRSMAGTDLTGFNGYKFNEPVPMQGGHGFMAENADKGAAWASGAPVIGRIANNVKKLSAEGDPVYFPYTAMGERSVDFSHHISSSLAEALQQQSVTRAAQREFNAAMKTPDASFGAVEDFPGVGSPKLKEFLLNSKGDVRNKFAKTMDTSKFQAAGFPSVAEARFATTDPRLLNAPTGASGLSISKLDPSGKVLKDVSGHQTYDTDLGGQYVGGLGRSIPKEVMYPDMISAYEKAGYKPNQFDYLMTRGLRGAPIAQQANQSWVDSVSKWLAQNPKEAMTYGAVALPAGAATGAPQPSPADMVNAIRGQGG